MVGKGVDFSLHFDVKSIDNDVLDDEVLPLSPKLVTFNVDRHGQFHHAVVGAALPAMPREIQKFLHGGGNKWFEGFSSRLCHFLTSKLRSLGYCGPVGCDLFVHRWQAVGDYDLWWKSIPASPWGEWPWLWPEK